MGLGGRRSSWESRAWRDRWVVGQRGRARGQDELYLGCRTCQQKGRQTLEIREIVATTQAKHGREGVKGTRN